MPTVSQIIHEKNVTDSKISVYVGGKYIVSEIVTSGKNFYTSKKNSDGGKTVTKS